MAGGKRNQRITVDALKALASSAVAGGAAAAKATGASALGVDPISAGLTVALTAIVGQMSRPVTREELACEVETIRTGYTRRTVDSFLDALSKYAKEAEIKEARTPLEELVKVVEGQDIEDEQKLLSWFVSTVCDKFDPSEEWQEQLASFPFVQISYEVEKVDISDQSSKIQSPTYAGDHKGDNVYYSSLQADEVNAEPSDIIFSMELNPVPSLNRNSTAIQVGCRLKATPREGLDEVVSVDYSWRGQVQTSKDLPSKFLVCMELPEKHRKAGENEISTRRVISGKVKTRDEREHSIQATVSGFKALTQGTGGRSWLTIEDGM